MVHHRPVLPQVARPPVQVRNLVRPAVPRVAPVRVHIPVPSAKTTATLTLSDTALMALMSRPDLKAEFPFMRITVPRISGGTCCGGARKANVQHQAALDSVKRQLAAMPLERKNRFKELNRVGQVVIFIAGSERFVF